MSSVKGNYDQTERQFTCNFSVTNVCYVAQCVFFGIATVSMYMLYSEANVVNAKVGTNDMDRFNLLWCTVLLLLLNETFFIPERFRKTCRTVAAFLVWNNFEAAGCAAKKFFHDVKADEVTEFTGDQIRITRGGMFGVLMSIVGSYLASYLLPNGKKRNSFTAYRFKECILQTVFYCIVAGLLLIATFVQWSRDDTCGVPAAATAGLAFTNYNATLLFVAFWIMFGLSTNDGNTLDVALSILCSELVKGRPVGYASDPDLAVIYSLVFAAAMLMIIGSMLHSGIWNNGFKTQGVLERVTTKAFALHIVSFILGIAGSACIFSKTKNKDELWVAFFTGWLCPILGILAQIFDAEAALIPALFYIPAAFAFYGEKFALTSTAAGSAYLTGYDRAGSLLLLVVPVISTLLFYTRSIAVQSFDEYLRTDGAAALKAAFLLLLSSALLWKSSSAIFWAILFISLLVFASSYNPRSSLPKAAVLLCIQVATMPQLWLIANAPELTHLPAVILFLGLWTYIAAFSTAGPDTLTILSVYHNNANGGYGDDALQAEEDNNGIGARLLGDQSATDANGYSSVGDSAPASSGPVLSTPANDDDDK